MKVLNSRLPDSRSAITQLRPHSLALRMVPGTSTCEAPPEGIRKWKEESNGPRIEDVLNIPSADSCAATLPRLHSQKLQRALGQRETHCEELRKEMKGLRQDCDRLQFELSRPVPGLQAQRGQREFAQLREKLYELCDRVVPLREKFPLDVRKAMRFGLWTPESLDWDDNLEQLRNAIKSLKEELDRLELELNRQTKLTQLVSRHQEEHVQLWKEFWEVFDRVKPLRDKFPLDVQKAMRVGLWEPENLDWVGTSEELRNAIQSLKEELARLKLELKRSLPNLTEITPSGSQNLPLRMETGQRDGNCETLEQEIRRLKENRERLRIEMVLNRPSSLIIFRTSTRGGDVHSCSCFCMYAEGGIMHLYTFIINKRVMDECIQLSE